MGRVPSTWQLALLAVSLTARDDEADDPVGYEGGLAGAERLYRRLGFKRRGTSVYRRKHS
jgi:hypothetical protein